MDAFYASVEQRDRPELRGLPLAVGGRGERGVVMTASYEARAFGVGSAMPTARALRLCPELVVVSPRFPVYHEVSRVIREIFLRATELVEPLSLDEAYLDVTRPNQGPPSATLQAGAIKRAILEETGLTASAGVASGKFLAKIASAAHKPDGLTVITPTEAAAFIAALPIERFHGVGPATAAKFRAMGVHNGADLRALSRPALEERFGKVGAFFHAIARGIDERPVVPDRERKSLGSEITFARDLRTREELEPVLRDLCDDVARHLERAGLAARTVTVKLRYADFTTVTRSRTLPSDVCEADELLQAAAVLAFSPDRPEGALRLLGVTLSRFVPVASRVVQPPIPFPTDGP